MLRPPISLLIKVSGHLGIENTLLLFIIAVDQGVSMALTFCAQRVQRLAPQGGASAAALVFLPKGLIQLLQF